MLKIALLFLQELRYGWRCIRSIAAMLEKQHRNILIKSIEPNEIAEFPHSCFCKYYVWQGLQYIKFKGWAKMCAHLCAYWPPSFQMISLLLALNVSSIFSPWSLASDRVAWLWRRSVARCSSQCMLNPLPPENQSVRTPPSKEHHEGGSLSSGDVVRHLWVYEGLADDGTSRNLFFLNFRHCFGCC